MLSIPISFHFHIEQTFFAQIDDIQINIKYAFPAQPFYMKSLKQNCSSFTIFSFELETCQNFSELNIFPYFSFS